MGSSVLIMIKVELLLDSHQFKMILAMGLHLWPLLCLEMFDHLLFYNLYHEHLMNYVKVSTHLLKYSYEFLLLSLFM